MLTFQFTGGGGKMTVPEVLTTGMVGKQVLLEFSPEWEGLVKTVVFSNGTVTRDVLFTGEPVAIPAAVLERPLRTLTVGVYGVADQGKMVIPTVRAVGPKILPGIQPSGDPSTDPELPVWAQLQAMIGNPEDLETQARENLVAAVNELALKIPESGATFTPSVDENGWLSWTNDKDLPNPEPVSVKGPRGIMGVQGEKGDRGDTGPMGPQGLRGEKGETPVRGTDYWTAADVAEIRAYVDNAILGGAW